jgi:hypothetical protein
LLGHILFLRRLLRPLRQNGFDAGYVAPQQSKTAWLFQLAALLLQTQVQTFLTQIALFGQKLVCGHLDDLFDLHISLGSGDVVPA